MYRLIMMDYNMPICNGIEATKMIRNHLDITEKQSQRETTLVSSVRPETGGLSATLEVNSHSQLR